jgi:hypothetical protein
MSLPAPQPLPARFSFQHPELRRPGTAFVRDASRAVMLKMDFGEMKGSLPLDRLAGSLQLAPDAADRQLLSLVPGALRYVRQVCADDPVPSELIDGRPSWLPRPHVLQRAVAVVWRAVQGPLAVLDSAPPLPAAGVPDADMRAVARNLLGLFPDITMAEVEQRLDAVVTDVARVDWLRRATAALQRTVGELAQFSVLHGNEAIGELARRSALQLREVTVWGTEKAIAADTAVGDINRLLAEPALLRRRAWPAICALRALALDVEPVLLQWQAARDRPDGGPRLRDIDEILRLVLQRYAGFNPAGFLPDAAGWPGGGLND